MKVSKISLTWENAKGIGHDIEDFPANKPNRVYAHVEKVWDECLKDHKPRIQLFDRNRRAYNGLDVDLWGGQASITADTKSGLTEKVQSTLMAEMIDAAARLQVAGNPRIYPLVVVDEDAFREADKIKNGGLNLEATLGMSPQEIVTRYVETCVNDMIERENFVEFYLKCGVDSFLESIVSCYQYIEHNRETGEDDVKSGLLDNRDVMFFPRNTRKPQEAKGTFITTYPTAWELKQLFPKDADEIRETETGESYDTEKPHDQDGSTKRYAGTVRVVQYFVWDNSKEKVVEPDSEDPKTGELIPGKKYEKLKYPCGRLIRFCPDLHLLLEDRAAEDDGETPTDGLPVGKLNYFPIATFIPFPVSHSVYGKCKGTPLRGLQASDTQMIQQLLINIRACAGAKIISVEGNIVNPENYTDMPGEIIMVRSLSQTQRQGAPNIVGEIANGIAMIERRAEKLSGANDAAQGMAPTANSSGRQVLALQAGSQMVLAPNKMLFRLFMIRQWKQILDLMRLVYKTGRYIRVRDEDGVPPVLPFDFSKVIISIDCDVSDESMRPVSPEARLQEQIQLSQLRDDINVPYVGPKQLFASMRMPDQRGLQRDYLERRARAEQNLQRAQGQAGQAAMQPNAGTGQPEVNTQESVGLTPSEIGTAAVNPAQPVT
jgi:hypothetical protein